MESSSSSSTSPPPSSEPPVLEDGDEDNGDDRNHDHDHDHRSGERQMKYYARNNNSFLKSRSIVVMIVVVVPAVVAIIAVVGKWNQTEPSNDKNQQILLNTTTRATESPCFDNSNSLNLVVDVHPESNNNNDYVSECCCSFADLETINSQTVYKLFDMIVRLPFFSHFRIDLCTDCTLWDDAPMCMLRDCSVCECEQPPEWLALLSPAEQWMPLSTKLATCDEDDDDDEDDAEVNERNYNSQMNTHERVVTTIDDHMILPRPDHGDLFDEAPLSSSSSSYKFDHDDTSIVVDLRLNPEQYTGYSGESAEKVWSAIHFENCFQPEDEEDNNQQLCKEQRVYNRILSGLHSSISLHIAHSYCLEIDEEKTWECKTWGLNNTLAKERVLDHPDRVENLYVAFATLLRAVQKAGPAVISKAAVQPSSEDDQQYYKDSLEEWEESFLPELTRLGETCPMTFDETSLLLLEDLDVNGQQDTTTATTQSNRRVMELQRRFHHLQKIIECVGCDRCKLWGTLQTVGVGVALKVLLHDDHGGDGELTLSRQEAVALVHTLERLSKSLKYVQEFREEN
eukprot:CAMPEP_0113503134 /NCGR_PEP_ID=MMETSP0014_2-20120614/33974_1 /TAXON_ID=2857 /ORGANISM="Nitzschia sp." /LENGTH=567 /DNA_ID=CAMNT_0000398065 /DNA_START=89 /DNA_END=1792 /DNA_ORIENTATION=- /assembly_acc=CAM_ASM_000159